MSILYLSMVALTTCYLTAPQVTDQDITIATEKIVKELEVRHDPIRCFEPTQESASWLAKYEGGTTAIATLALLCAEQSINTPWMEQSLAYLWGVKEPSTYVLAIRTSIWAMLPDRYEDRLKHDTKRLIATMGAMCGGWGNGVSPPKTLQSASPLLREFGMIALRESGRCGIDIPKQCWSAIANATLATQHRNGGWAYEQGANRGKVTANMTVAGLNCLLGVDEVFGDDLKESDAIRLHTAIDRGIAWLNKHARTDINSGGTALMSYLYALERAAMSCGLAEIRHRDWFLDGSNAVLEAHCQVRKAKGSTINLSFALLFLTRGRIPLALCELTVDTGRVDPMRFSDTMTQRISNFTEQPLGWRLVTNDDTVETWLAAPLLFIQDTQAIPKDLSKLNTYLDQGGMLVMLATGNTIKLCTTIADQLCPTIVMEKVSKEHWTRSLLHKTSNTRVYSWHDGIRDRILLVEGSPERVLEQEKGKLSKVLMNICCGAAELHAWHPRLHQRAASQTQGSIVLAQHQGSWDIEKIGLSHWNVKTMSLDEAAGTSLILVGGIDASEATETLANSIIHAAKEGSTVLIETIGGRGKFASKMRQQIAEKTGIIVQQEKTLQPLTGRRGWTIRQHKAIDPPLVAVIGKGRVLFVDCDLRNALLDQPTWGVHGYDTVSAIKLIDTLLAQCD